MSYNKRRRLTIQNVGKVIIGIGMKQRPEGCNKWMCVVLLQMEEDDENRKWEERVEGAHCVE